jgi:hypothetical protein
LQLERASAPLRPLRAQLDGAAWRTRATPVAPGARRPERSRWRCGAPRRHGEASPPSDHCRLALFVARAGPLLSGGPLAAADEQGGVRGGAMMAAERRAMP